MSTPILASELAPIPDGFGVLDFTTEGTIKDKWSGDTPSCKSFIIQPIGGDLEWRVDGTDVTAGNGLKILDGQMHVFENQPNIFEFGSFIGASNVRVHLFG